jgi:hypothetical protein
MDHFAGLDGEFREGSGAVSRAAKQLENEHPLPHRGPASGARAFCSGPPNGDPRRARYLPCLGGD